MLSMMETLTLSNGVVVLSWGSSVEAGVVEEGVGLTLGEGEVLPLRSALIAATLSFILLPAPL